MNIIIVLLLKSHLLQLLPYVHLNDYLKRTHQPLKRERERERTKTMLHFLSSYFKHNRKPKC